MVYILSFYNTTKRKEGVRSASYIFKFLSSDDELFQSTSTLALPISNTSSFLYITGVAGRDVRMNVMNL